MVPRPASVRTVHVRVVVCPPKENAPPASDPTSCPSLVTDAHRTRRAGHLPAVRDCSLARSLLSPSTSLSLASMSEAPPLPSVVVPTMNWSEFAADSGRSSGRSPSPGVEEPSSPAQGQRVRSSGSRDLEDGSSMPRVRSSGSFSNEFEDLELRSRYVADSPLSRRTIMSLTGEAQGRAGNAQTTPSVPASAPGASRKSRVGRLARELGSRAAARLPGLARRGSMPETSAAGLSAPPPFRDSGDGVVRARASPFQAPTPPIQISRASPTTPRRHHPLAPSDHRLT